MVLSFINLVVGNRYRVDLSTRFSLIANDNVQIQIDHGTILPAILGGNGGATGAVTNHFMSHEFIAVETTVGFIAASITAGSKILGSGNIANTWARITEVNNVEETTDFS
jgi:hypothetical protein